MKRIGNIYEHQPESCRKPLPSKEIVFFEWMDKYYDEKTKAAMVRIICFDPKPIYDRIGHKINPFARHQSIQMDDAFPKSTDGMCACGCGEMSATYGDGEKYRKWKNSDCQFFASNVLSIINNYFKKPAFFISLYHGEKCINCDAPNGLELDHIIPVKHGGGGCWLSNYEWKCRNCHVTKTNKDFGRKGFGKPSPPNQINLEFGENQTPHHNE